MISAGMCWILGHDQERQWFCPLVPWREKHWRERLKAVNCMYNDCIQSLSAMQCSERKKTELHVVQHPKMCTICTIFNQDAWLTMYCEHLWASKGWQRGNRADEFKFNPISQSPTNIRPYYYYYTSTITTTTTTTTTTTITTTTTTTSTTAAALLRLLYLLCLLCLLLLLILLLLLLLA